MKKFFDPLTTAFTGVITHKLRSFLTMLGIVIGVGAVIALMSVGKGAEANIISNIQGLGSDLITISPGATMSFGGIRGAVGSTTTLTQEDAEAIAEQVAYVDAVAPYNTSFMQLIVGGENMNSRVSGVTLDYFDVYNLELNSGSFFTAYDYQRASKVAVIGANVKDTLFGEVDPLGQRIRMGNNVITVVGVLESQGISMMGSADDSILIPLSALQQIVAQSRTSTGEHNVSSIPLSVTDEDKVEEVTEAITELLRTRHKLGPGVDDDFSITSVEQLTSTLTETIGTLTLLLGAIAAISLLVGGIGVMNIMLVSVLERTREIGIRKALGAKQRDIWSQFLIESALLTFTGGLIGVAAGWAVSYFVDRSGFMTTVVTADIVILAVSVSVGIGLFFGFYPAWSASRLNPIDALRSE